jgi:hypothetical protein
VIDDTAKMCTNISRISMSGDNEMTKISPLKVLELVPALFSVNYNAERLETECSSTAKYS